MRYFRVPTPEWESVCHLWDKRNTYSLAARLNIPVPRTWTHCDADRFAELGPHLPLAIKPAIKENFVYATGDKCWRADTVEELRQLFARARCCLPADEIMLQDIIPGGGDDQLAYCAFFKSGKPLASMVVSRRRQHPREFGRASTCVETIDCPEVENLAVRFLSAINYYGLVEVEFKRDSRDGNYRLLDVNGRTWGYHTLGCRAGVDFPWLLFADQVNQPVHTCRAAAGVRWVRLLTDLPTGISGVVHGEFGCKSYLASLWNCNEEAVFSIEDPLPAVAEIALAPYIWLVRGALPHLRSFVPAALRAAKKSRKSLAAGARP
ncbi:MAG: ATP-grasp domain-containing protein [Acidobacteria bacterium]|nr:ATP-grasp domain-containing protein [Acidobacteriota bacterium]